MFRVEQRGAVTVVEMAHGKANVVDMELCRGTVEQFAALRASAAKAVVLTGNGSIFSAGVDLLKVLDGGADYVRPFLKALDDLLEALFLFPKPLVAAVNGHAIAGGCIIAAACDWRVMSAGTIGVTELLVGVPFPPSALEILRFAIGPAAARMVMSGQTLSPHDAQAIGLVDEVVEPEALLDRAVGHARALAVIPAQTFTLTKHQLRREVRERIDADERAYANRMFDAWASPAAQTAIARYLDQLNERRSRAT